MNTIGSGKKTCIFVAVFVIVIMLLILRAEGATVRQYTSGGSPCAGACSFDWAKEQFDVPDGEPLPIIIPKGSYIHMMSYAKDGEPFWEINPGVFADDEPGIGYWFTHLNGQNVMMVRIDASMNWAVVAPPMRAISTKSAREPQYSISIPSSRSNLMLGARHFHQSSERMKKPSQFSRTIRSYGFFQLPAKSSAKYSSSAPARVSTFGDSFEEDRITITDSGRITSLTCCEVAPAELLVPQTPIPVPISSSVTFTFLAIIALILLRCKSYAFKKHV